MRKLKIKRRMEAMNYEEVYDYVSKKINYFPKKEIDRLTRKLYECDPDAFEEIKKCRLKNPTLIQIVSIFLGIYGVDRFLVGDIVYGVLKLLTGGGFLILWLVDIFKIKEAVREENLAKVEALSLPDISTIIGHVEFK